MNENLKRAAYTIRAATFQYSTQIIFLRAPMSLGQVEIFSISHLFFVCCVLFVVCTVYSLLEDEQYAKFGVLITLRFRVIFMSLSLKFISN